MDKFFTGTVAEAAPHRGPTSSEVYNSFNKGTVSDFLSLQYLWNSFIHPLLDTLPGGRTVIPAANRVPYPDAFKNGLDAANIYVDNNQKNNSAYSVLFYNNTDKRPNTIKETFSYLFLLLSTRAEELSRRIDEMSYGTAISDLQTAVASLEGETGNIEHGSKTFASTSTAVVTGLNFNTAVYTITLTANSPVLVWWSNKTANGFTINVSDASFTGTVDWTAKENVA